GERILVADDNPGVRASLEGLLQDLYLEPELVSSGAEAVARLLACNTGGDGPPFSRVLLDWRMPGMDGDATAVEMRAALESPLPRPQRPVILLLAPFGVSEAISRMEKSGMDGFIDKPVTRSRLIRGLSEGEEFDAGQLDRRREKLLGQEEETGARIGGARVLLAQAGDVTPRIIRELLERVGVVVELAGDAATALEMAARYPFDAVLLDYHLPELGGASSAQKIRELPGCRELPIIALLSHAGWEEKKHCLDAGMRDHLELPPRAERLHGLLTKWITPYVHGEEPEGFPRQDHVLGRISGLDLMLGLERIGGNRGLYRRLLVRFRRDYEGIGEWIRSRFAAGAFLECVPMLHSLKAAARNLGMISLAESAEALEGALTSGEAVLRQAALPSGCG
ncbi:MAG: response regulator, partial [Magnetococcales bacterium]|nr:response regulator [Magnetococcales bacterium]